MMITWATWLTISRIILTPFIVQSLMYSQWMKAGLLFAVAALTDTFDGALARSTGQATMLGAYLDPLADKILLVSCYTTLLWFHGSTIGIPAWLVGMVVIRELLLVAGGLTLYVRSSAHRSPFSSMVQPGLVIQPSLVGKWTTVIHCILLGSIYAVKAGLFSIGSWYFYSLSILVAIFMVLSALQYMVMWACFMRLMRFLSFYVLCVLSSCVTSFYANDDFTIKRPTSGVYSRQQLRDHCAELLSEYLVSLVKELELIAKRLTSIVPCSEREQQKCRTYVRTLHEARQFLRDGSLREVQCIYNDTNHEDVSKVYGSVIDAIAATQRELINVLRCLLERDAQCCFVACKAKSQLEKYLQHIRDCIQVTARHHEYVTTIVQNVEKSSE